MPQKMARKAAAMDARTAARKIAWPRVSTSAQSDAIAIEIVRRWMLASQASPESRFRGAPATLR